MRPNITRRAVLGYTAAGITGMSMSAAGVKKTQGRNRFEIWAAADVEFSYQFTTDGPVDPVTSSDGDHGAEPGGNDTVRNLGGGQYRVTGTTGFGYNDIWLVDGQLLEFTTEASRNEYKLLWNGTEISPPESKSDGNRFEIWAAADVEFSYQFTTDGPVDPVTSSDGDHGAEPGGNDTVRNLGGGQYRVTGTTGFGYNDIWLVDGQLLEFTTEASRNEYKLLWNGSERLPNVNLDNNPVSDSEQNQCILGHFRDYSIKQATTHREMQRVFAEAANEAELINQLSEFNIKAIQALEAIAELHYGDFTGAAKEFLELLYDNTYELKEANDPLIYDSVNNYSKYANSIYSLVNGPTESVTGYADLIQDAVEIRQEQNYDSMKAALRVAAEGATGSVQDTIKENAVGLAVEIGELPLDDAVTGLKVNAQEALVLKVHAESQLPILEELEELARKRDRGTITEKEMYGYIIYGQEYWSAATRFNNQIVNLEQLGREESIIFEAGRKINELLGNNVLEASKEAVENSQAMYETKTRQLAGLRNDKQKC